jgi:hypothetical protein
MHDRSLLTLQFAQQITYRDQAYHNKEDDGMRIGEGGDELRYWIIGHHIGYEFRLVYPSERGLVASHLHPNGINGISGNHTDIRHNKMVVPSDDKRIYLQIVDHLFGLLFEQDQRITFDNEIIVFGIVVSRKK